jgi:hypothetical protein
MTDLNEKVLTVINNVLSIPDDRFDALLEAAGLDPKRDLRFADLRKVDFGGSVMHEWDLTGADLRGASFRGARILNCIFTDAKGVNLSGSIDEKAAAAERRPQVKRQEERELKLSLDQRYALAAIVQYHLMISRRRGDRLSYRELGYQAGLDRLIGYSGRDTVAKAVMRVAEGIPSIGTAELCAFYENLLLKDQSFLESAPTHVQSAIAVLYPLPSAGGKTSDVGPYSLRDVLFSIRNRNPVAREQLKEGYTGIWDLIQYTVRESRMSERSMETDDRRVVRGAMEIGSADSERKDAWFSIYSYDRFSQGLRVASGSVNLINRGRYLYMVGVDHDQPSPLFIVAPFSSEKSISFSALIMRQVSNGPIIVSRMSCVRSNAKSIDDLREKVGVYSETEIRRLFSKEIRDLDRRLEDAVSDVGGAGSDTLPLELLLAG